VRRCGPRGSGSPVDVRGLLYVSGTRRRPRIPASPCSGERRGDAATMPAVPQGSPGASGRCAGCRRVARAGLHDDPMLTYMFPDPGLGNEPAPLLQAPTPPDVHEDRTPYTTEECRSTALWIPPRAGPPAMRDAIDSFRCYCLGRRRERHSASNSSSPSSEDAPLLPGRAWPDPAVAGKRPRLCCDGSRA